MKTVQFETEIELTAEAAMPQYQELSDLQLALVGGGIADTIGH
jgi:hypothetical protein